MPGKRMRSIAKNRRSAYEGMRAGGLSKGSAARIANAGKTKTARKKMARKAARTRARRR